MKVIQKIKVVLQILKNSNKYKIIHTSVKISKLYGINGLIKAIFNKMNGRELLYDIVSNAKNSNRYCMYVLLKQQRELTNKKINNTTEYFPYEPLISVIMPIYEPKLDYLKEAIESLQKQYYVNWELCAVDDGSKCKDGIDIVKEYMLEDKRIHLFESKINQGISSASNIAINIANGEYIALLDQDDELSPDAFYWVVKAINDNKQADFLYSDECKFSNRTSKKYFDFLFKPNWDPNLLINNMFIGHLAVYKTQLIKDNSGFNSKFDFGQDYELAVRIGDIAENIVHIPRILYFWRAVPSSTACGGKPFSNKINKAVPQFWLKSKGLNCVIKKNGDYNYPIILAKHSKVSIIINTIELKEILASIDAIVENTEYIDYELIVISNKFVQKAIKEKLPYIGNVKYIFTNAGSFLKNLNSAADEATGEILVFLKANCFPVNKTWLIRLVDSLFLPNIGAVSPATLDSKKCIQYAGSSIYFRNNYSFIGTPYWKQNFYGRHEYYLLNPLVSKECASLSRDCIVVKKNIFESIGGFDCINTSKYCFNEDFSFRLREGHLHCFYNANSQVMNIEDGEVKNSDEKTYEYLYCILKWAKYYMQDPYYTQMMKNQLESVNSENEEVFINESINYKNVLKKKKILVVSHELTRTGAPIVVLDAVKEMINAGYFVTVISPFDGELRLEYESIHVPVIIDRRLAWGRCAGESIALFSDDWCMDKLIKEYDLILINTLMGHNLITRYQKYGIPIIWWIHEGSCTLDIVAKYLPKKLFSNVHILFGGEYTQKMLNKYVVNYKGTELLYGVPDYSLKYMSSKKCNDKVKFLIVGTVDKRKAQDLAIKAIKKLGHDILRKTEFIFIGDKNSDSVYREITKFAIKYKNVKIIVDKITRNELFEFYSNADCLLCPSRDDPMPVVMVEAMVFSKPCLCSTGTGTAQYITDGENGFIFENNNAKMLAEKITYLVNNRDKLSEIGKNGRLIYKKYFSMDVFHKNLLLKIDNALNR